MICGNAEFMGIPWDIIIKGYRKQLKDRSFDTLQDYADDLISCPQKNRPFKDTFGVNSV